MMLSGRLRHLCGGMCGPDKLGALGRVRRVEVSRTAG
jgi:hypothetical protein